MVWVAAIILEAFYTKSPKSSTTPIRPFGEPSLALPAVRVALPCMVTSVNRSLYERLPLSFRPTLRKGPIPGKGNFT